MFEQWSVGFSIQDKAMDVTPSAPQGAHYHADVIYLLPYLGVKKEAWGLRYCKLGLRQHSFCHGEKLTFAFYTKV